MLVPFAISLTLSLTGSAVAQEVPPQEVFVLAEWTKSFETHLAEKEDSLAVLELGNLGRAYEKLEEKEQKAAAKTVSDGLDQRRAEDDCVLYLAVVDTLGSMGEQGARSLQRALRHPNVDKRATVLGAAVEALGRTHEPKVVDVIAGYLYHKSPEVIGAAARSLGEFEKAPERDRKNIVEELLKQYSAIYSNSLPPGKNEREAGQRAPRADEETYKVVRPSFEAALARLTGQKLDGSNAWYRWFNENRKKRWDEREAPAAHRP